MMTSQRNMNDLLIPTSPGSTMNEIDKRWWKAILEDNVDALRELVKFVSLETDVDIDRVQELVEASITVEDDLCIPCVARLLPLHLACVCGHQAVVKLLLTSGADAEGTLTDGETPIHFACLYGQLESAMLLIEYGCDVNAQTRGDTALMLAVACYGKRHLCSDDRYVAISRCLLDAGCDVNITDSQGLTALHLAAGKEDSTMLKLLIKHGADVNVKSSSLPRTPLLCAVSAELEENARLLLSAGCQVNNVVFPGVTALSTALGNNSLSMILDLLKAGANPQSRTDTLDVQVYVANKQYVTILLLLAYGLDVNWQSPYDKASLLVGVSRNQSIAMSKLLLIQYGADPELETRLGTTPVWAAVKTGNLDLVKLYLRWNSDLDIQSLEYNPLIPISPIQLALINGNKAIAHELLHFGCRLNMCWLKNEPLVRRLNERVLLKRWLADYLAKVTPLQHMCMVVIRRSIGEGLPLKIRKLRLPTRLKKYVIFGNM